MPKGEIIVVWSESVEGKPRLGHLLEDDRGEKRVVRVRDMGVDMAEKGVGSLFCDPNPNPKPNSATLKQQ